MHLMGKERLAIDSGQFDLGNPHNQQRDNKIRKRAHKNNFHKQLILDALAFQPSHRRRDFAKRKKLWTKAQNDIRRAKIQYKPHMPPILEKAAIRNHEISNPKHLNSQTISLKQLSDRLFLANDSHDLEQLFLRPLFDKDAKTLKKMVTFFTDINPSDLKLFFAHRSHRVVDNRPNYQLIPFETSDQFNKMGFRIIDLLKTYNKYIEISEKQNVKLQTFTGKGNKNIEIILAAVYSQEGDLLFQLSHTPSELDFNMLEGPDPGKYAANGDITIRWMGQQKMTNENKVEVLKNLLKLKNNTRENSQKKSLAHKQGRIFTYRAAPPSKTHFPPVKGRIFP